MAKAYPTNKLPDLRGEFIRGGMTGGELIQGVPCLMHNHIRYRSYSLYGVMDW